MHLGENDDACTTFEADRSGMWINRHARGAVVGAVMAGSPADDAGLQADDVIVSVDGEPASVIGPDALRRRLAGSAAGSGVVFDVLRGAVAIQAALVLRDLV